MSDRNVDQTTGEVTRQEDAPLVHESIAAQYAALEDKATLARLKVKEREDTWREQDAEYLWLAHKAAEAENARDALREAIVEAFDSAPSGTSLKTGRLLVTKPKRAEYWTSEWSVGDMRSPEFRDALVDVLNDQLGHFPMNHGDLMEAAYAIMDLIGATRKHKKQSATRITVRPPEGV